KPRLSLLWASQTGNAETLAEKVAAQLNSAGWEVIVQAMDDYSFESLASETHAVFITSTFGDGDAPDNGQNFWQQLDEESSVTLNQLNYALLALGDSDYPQFCGHGKNLDARLQALGATPLLARLDCDTDFENTSRQWVSA